MAQPPVINRRDWHKDCLTNQENEETKKQKKNEGRKEGKRRMKIKIGMTKKREREK